jgi:hypothetical protein
MKIISKFSICFHIWPGILRVTVWNAIDLLPMDVHLDLKRPVAEWDQKG